MTAEPASARHRGQLAGQGIRRAAAVHLQRDTAGGRHQAVAHTLDSRATPPGTGP